MKDTILIKSIDRQAGTSSNFTTFSSLIIEGTYILKYCVIPNTIFNVNESNRRFKLVRGASTYSLQLPVGNYNPDSFVAMLSAGMSSIDVANPYAVTYDPATYAITINNTAFNSFGLVLPSVAVRSLFGISVETTAINSSITGDSVINLGSPDSIGIQIQQSQTRGFENIASDCCGTLYVPLNKAFGTYQALSSLELPQHVSFNQRQRQLNIRVVDTSTNEELDLNGGNFELLLSRV